MQVATEAAGAQIVALNTALAQPAAQTVAYAATLNVDAAAGSLVVVGTLTGNVTIAAPTNPTTGARLTYVLTQDGTGSRTGTWNSVFKLATSLTLTTTASKVDVISFVYDGTNWRETARALNQS